MSQTKVWAADKGLATRTNADGSSHQGAGGSQRLYTGRYSGKQYTSYIRFNQDWTGVGQIVSASASFYTDDGLGIMDSTTTEHPTVIMRRLKESFSEGSNNSAMISGDYDSANATTSDGKTKEMSRAVFGLTNIDVTAMVEDMAPKTVKRRDGTPGGNLTNHGFKLTGSTDTKKNWAGFSEDYTDPTYRPIITLTYEYGVTVPDVPSAMTPSGSVEALTTFEGDFNDTKPSDVLRATAIEVYSSAVTNTGQTINLNGGRLVYGATQNASESERTFEHFEHTPNDLILSVNTTYKWRARVKDNEGQWSQWSNLVSFSVTNTAPNAPTLLAPADAKSVASLDSTQFKGRFTDPDAGDKMVAYQVQLSAYAEGDAHWLDDEFILWNTGKRYIDSTLGETDFATKYGGASLTAGTYYWRARTWDQHQTVGPWVYRSIVLSADFAPNPDGTQTSIQIRPRAPWRIVIKDMFEADGVTRKAGRGPGNTIAVLEDAKNVGASTVYNSPGELHFTLGISHAQISLLEPRQTHYSVQTRQGDGWREWTAGLMMDFDATDTDVVFYGTDYLGLMGTQYDERYDPSNPDKPTSSGGSKYVNKTIGYIVRDQLSRIIAQSNSPLGFITINQNLATYESLLPETVTVFSTYVNVMDFVMGLIDSHRAGTGKKTRLQVRQKTGGGYEFYLEDDPGTTRDNLRLKYGELAQGFRVIPFGKEWASSIAAIGRSKDGVRVMYKSQSAPGIDEATWGHFVQARLFDGISDENDLIRRNKQAAIHAGKLGKSIAIGLRASVLKPFDGYTICDAFPVKIVRGPIDTDSFGSGYWTCVGVTWTVDAKTKRETTTLSLTPRDDTTAPDADLLILRPINPQAEWQIGWRPPTTAHTLLIAMDTGLLMDDDHLMDDAAVAYATGSYHIDVTTGAVYELQDDGSWLLVGNPPTIARPTSMIPSTRVTINDVGVAVANLSVTVTP